MSSCHHVSFQLAHLGACELVSNTRTRSDPKLKIVEKVEKPYPSAPGGGWVQSRNTFIMSPSMDDGRCISKECVMVQPIMFCLYNIYLLNTCLYYQVFIIQCLNVYGSTDNVFCRMFTCQMRV